jgi:MFS family permease
MTPDADGLPAPQRRWAMLAIGLAIMMAVLDGAIANVALPTIARALRTSPAQAVWVVNAYQLVITMLLLPLASLGEIVGYRRVYRVGLVVFTLASTASSTSSSSRARKAAAARLPCSRTGCSSASPAMPSTACTTGPAWRLANTASAPARPRPAAPSSTSWCAARARMARGRK